MLGVLLGESEEWLIQQCPLEVLSLLIGIPNRPWSEKKLNVTNLTYSYYISLGHFAS